MLKAAHEPTSHAPEPQAQLLLVDLDRLAAMLTRLSGFGA